MFDRPSGYMVFYWHLTGPFSHHIMKITHTQQGPGVLVGVLAYVRRTSKQSQIMCIVCWHAAVFWPRFVQPAALCTYMCVNDQYADYWHA